MALVRNKRTGVLIECTEVEAKLLTCPEGFRAYIKQELLQSRSLRIGSSLNGPGMVKHEFVMSSGTFMVEDVLEGLIERLPDTVASRALYGK